VPLSSLDPRELSYRAAAIEDLRERIATSTHAEGEWWNSSTYEESAGRTPTEAWLAGDHGAVVRLVDIWYERSERRSEEIRNDPAFLEMLEERRRPIAAKDGHRRSA
jgi:hypothetical protein